MLALWPFSFVATCVTNRRICIFINITAGHILFANLKFVGMCGLIMLMLNGCVAVWATDITEFKTVCSFAFSHWLPVLLVWSASLTLGFEHMIGQIHSTDHGFEITYQQLYSLNISRLLLNIMFLCLCPWC